MRPFQKENSVKIELKGQIYTGHSSKEKKESGKKKKKNTRANFKKKQLPVEKRKSIIQRVG